MGFIGFGVHWAEIQGLYKIFPLPATPAIKDILSRLRCTSIYIYIYIYIYTYIHIYIYIHKARLRGRVQFRVRV